MPSNRPSARLVHHHVGVLRSALVTAQPPDQPPHGEALAEPSRELARAQHGGMLACETDRADVETGADLVGERGGRSGVRLGHALAAASLSSASVRGRRPGEEFSVPRLDLGGDNAMAPDDMQRGDVNQPHAAHCAPT
jgi:hypothetical protein